MPTIIFESDEILVLNKPAGLIVHSDGRTEESSVVDWILAHYPALVDVGEVWVSPQGEVIPLPGIVHRLDRTTSGVMIVAKTAESYTHLKRGFKERSIKKTYLAYVYGYMAQEEGEIVAEIVRSKGSPKRWYARATSKEDKRAAITQWRLINKLCDPVSGEPLSFIEASPLTGRTHQIRVHLASIGHPIVADRLYAREKKSVLGFERPALHAHTISLTLEDVSRTYTAASAPDFEHASSSNLESNPEEMP